MKNGEIIQTAITQHHTILVLGCGSKRMDNAINIDKIKTGENVVEWDLETGLPKEIPNDYITLVMAEDVLEHISRPVTLWNDIMRVCKTSAEIHIRTPHPLMEGYWADPDHKRGYVKQTFINICDPNCNMKNYGYRTGFKLMDYKVIDGAQLVTLTKL